MASGGIFDHVGGGFCRYSVDEYWMIPHFEKMLYDQAMLSLAYIQAYQVTGKETYAQVAKEVFDYVLRDMTDQKSGFYSAEDADSEGEEGKFYVWHAEELDDLLGANSEIVKRYYNVASDGNWSRGKTFYRHRCHLKHLLQRKTWMLLNSAELLKILKQLC